MAEQERAARPGRSPRPSGSGTPRLTRRSTSRAATRRRSCACSLSSPSAPAQAGRGAHRGDHGPRAGGLRLGPLVRLRAAAPRRGATLWSDRRAGAIRSRPGFTRPSSRPARSSRGVRGAMNAVCSCSRTPSGPRCCSGKGRAPAHRQRGRFRHHRPDPKHPGGQPRARSAAARRAAGRAAAALGDPLRLLPSLLVKDAPGVLARIASVLARATSPSPPCSSASRTTRAARSRSSSSPTRPARPTSRRHRRDRPPTTPPSPALASSASRAYDCQPGQALVGGREARTPAV